MAAISAGFPEKKSGINCRFFYSFFYF